VLNVYEAVDVLALIQDETYENLRLMVKDALYLRSDAVNTVLSVLTNRNSREYLPVLSTILWIIFSRQFVELDFIDL
jgi:hypothetical protein